MGYDYLVERESCVIPSGACLPPAIQAVAFLQHVGNLGTKVRQAKYETASARWSMVFRKIIVRGEESSYGNNTMVKMEVRVCM